MRDYPGQRSPIGRPDVAGVSSAITELFPALAMAAAEEPQNFVGSLIDSLVQMLPIDAASFYSCDAEKRLLLLRGQAGFDYRQYESYEVPVDTPGTECVKSGKVFACSEASISPDHPAEHHIGAPEYRAVIGVPLPFRSKRHPQVPCPIGVLYIYPSRPDDLELLSVVLEKAAPVIGLLYVASLDQIKWDLRRGLVDRAAYSRELGGLLHRAIRVFRDAIPFQGVSIFLQDERNDFLRLQGTTGLSDHRLKGQLFYMPGSRDLTRSCYDNGREVLLRETDEITAKIRPIEIVADRPQNYIILPIHEAAVHPLSQRRIIGVLRAINHTVTHQGERRWAAFGWEELEQARFFCEMLAVLVHFLARGMAAADDFDRRMHGAKNSLQAAIFYMELLESYGTHMSELPVSMEHYLSDSISFVSDVWSQIRRLDLVHTGRDIHLGRVALYGDVLSKIPPMVRRLAHSIRVGEFEVTRLSDAGFDKLPPVKGNANALLSVFRNLAENAVKYYRRDRRPRKLEFSYEVTAQTVKIFVTDNGMGIRPEDANLIFVEGFRSEQAIGRYPSSCGLGLSDAAELMEIMNGAIRHRPDLPGTTFEVEIPRF